MAPSQSQINRSDQTHNPPSYMITKTGSSKAQLCLQKILHTILTIPSHSSPPSTLKIDIQDVPPPKNEDPESPPAAADEGLAANGLNDDGKLLEQERVEAVEEIENKGEDYMELLIEAAKMIFGEIKEEEEEEKKSSEEFKDDSTTEIVGEKLPRLNKRRNYQRWTVDLYADMELEPVVRSKRGRTRVLPCKYRDSVLEPLTRVPRNRSTTASIIPNKRRLR